MEKATIEKYSKMACDKIREVFAESIKECPRYKASVYKKDVRIPDPANDEDLLLEFRDQWTWYMQGVEHADKEITALKERLTPIPVSERLPEEEQEVLFWADDIKNPAGELLKPICSFGWFRKGFFYTYIGHPPFEKMHATHWLPIPPLNEK